MPFQKSFKSAHPTWRLETWDEARVMALLESSYDQRLHKVMRNAPSIVEKVRLIDESQVSMTKFLRMDCPVMDCIRCGGKPSN